MLGLNKIQTGLTFLQAVPLIGPVVWIAKGAVSLAQIVMGVALGVLCGTAAGACCVIRANGATKIFSASSSDAFKEAGKGLGHLFLATLSLAILAAAAAVLTLGLAYTFDLIVL